MVNEQPNRAQRRRSEKERQDLEEKYGKLYPRSFDRCPHCGCPARFTLEAMKEFEPEEKLKVSLPVSGSMEAKFETPSHIITVITVWDSCVKCGTVYTVARDVIKRLKIFQGPPPRGLMPPFFKG